MYIAYIFAYNIGLLLFVAAYHIRPHINPFIHLGNIGFAFFLGAGLPIGWVRSIVGPYIDFTQSTTMQIVSWLLQFVLAVIFAWLLTEYIERPILNWARRVERGL